MGEVVRLESDCALSWSVETALEFTLAKIRDGTYKADKIYIALCSSPTDGHHHADTSYVMAGMQAIEALGWLHLHMKLLSSEDD